MLHKKKRQYDRLLKFSFMTSHIVYTASLYPRRLYKKEFST